MFIVTLSSCFDVNCASSRRQVKSIAKFNYFEYSMPQYFPGFHGGALVYSSQSEARFLKILYWRYPIADEIDNYASLYTKQSLLHCLL